jgi:hypothetical protein
VTGNKKGNMMAMAARVMVMATRVAGNKEGNCMGGKSNGKGKEGGGHLWA